MASRRTYLAVCALLLVASAARRGIAGEGDMVDAELDATVGQSTGGWGCGQASHARYAGGAGRIRWVGRPREDDTELAPSADATVSLEVESQHRVAIGGDCANDPSPCRPLPPTGTMGAGSVRFGGQSRTFGFDAGVLFAEYWNEGEETSSALHPWPDARLRFGHADRGLRFTLGTGAATATQVRRFSLLYFGLAYGFEHGHIELLPSVSRCGPSDDLCSRIDAQTVIPLSEHFGLRVGATLSSYTDDLKVTSSASTTGALAPPTRTVHVASVDPAATLGLAAAF